MSDCILYGMCILYRMEPLGKKDYEHVILLSQYNMKYFLLDKILLIC